MGRAKQRNNIIVIESPDKVGSPQAKVAFFDLYFDFYII